MRSTKWLHVESKESSKPERQETLRRIREMRTAGKNGAVERINDIAELLELLQQADPSRQADVMLESASALTTVFSGHLRRAAGSWLAPANSGGEKPSAAAAAVGDWLSKRYTATHTALLSLIGHDEPLVAWTGVHCVFKLLSAEQQVGVEGRSTQQNEALAAVIGQLVLSAAGKEAHQKIVDRFVQTYANQYGDVYVKTLACLRKLAELRAAHDGDNDDDDEEEEEEEEEERRPATSGRKRTSREPEQAVMSPQLRRIVEAPSFADNVYAILCGLRRVDADCSLPDLLSPSATQKGASLRSETKKQRGQAGRSAAAAAVKTMRVALDRAWMAFLKLRLPRAILKSLLHRFDEKLLGVVMHPCLLMDFFTDAYNYGGMFSLLSLGGLFHLMTKHNLDYPDFYRKFYALLTPDVFLVAHRDEVFKYAMLFLSSTHLPAYLAAAFIKRFATLALSAPASGCLLCMVIIFNLLYKHPQTGVLINRKLELVQVQDSASGLLLPAEPAATATTDPYLADEPDPAKCNALASSLWELEVLESHYCSTVAKFVKVFQKPYDPKAKQYPVAEFAAISFSSLIRRDANKRLEFMPIEFEKPAKLFQEGSILTTLWNWD